MKHGLLPWASVRLGEVAEFRNGLNFVRTDNGSQVKVIGVADFQQYFRIGYDSLESVRIAGQVDEEDLLQNGDLLFVRSNGNKALIGRCLLIENLNEAVSFSGFTIRARLDQQQILPAFASYLFRSSSVRSQLSVAGGGTNISNLSQGILSQLTIPLPAVPEQEKIAGVLGTWDEALEKLDALIAAKERRKQGLMQQLVTGKRRLPQFTEPWQWRRLHELCTRIERKAPIGIDRVLSITAGVGFQDQREKFSRVIAGRNIENYIHLKRGEFSYNKGNSNLYPQGCIYRLEEYDEGAVPNVWVSFAIKSQDLNSKFLTQFFLAGGHNHQLSRLINFGVRNDGLLNLTADNFFSIKIPVPPLDEQQRLGELFEGLADELRLLRNEREALDEQKRGLIQQLLTGKVRI